MKHQPTGKENPQSHDDVALWSNGIVRFGAGLRDELDLWRFDAVQTITHPEKEALELRFYIGEEYYEQFNKLSDSNGTPRVCVRGALSRMGKKQPQESSPVDFLIMSDGRILVDVSDLEDYA